MDHRWNLSFPDEGLEKDPKPDIHITKCNKLLPNYPLKNIFTDSFNLDALDPISVHDIYIIRILLQKDIKESQHGGILCKEDNGPDESHLISLKYIYYSYILRFCRTNIRHTISSTTVTIDPRDSIQYLCFNMDHNTRVKVNIMMNGYADTSIATIDNVLLLIMVLLTLGSAMLKSYWLR